MHPACGEKIDDLVGVNFYPDVAAPGAAMPFFFFVLEVGFGLRAVNEMHRDTGLLRKEGCCKGSA